MSQVVALPPHGNHIHISNLQRSGNESAFEFRVPPLGMSLSGVGSYLMQIKHVLTQNAVPTIQRAKSDALRIAVSGVETEIVLESGFYHADSLVTALNTAFAAVNPGLIFTYNSDTRTLTLAVPGGITFMFVSPNQYLDQDRPNFQSKYDRLYAMMGFYTQRDVLYTGATNIIANDPINLVPTMALNVCVNQHMDVYSTSRGNRQVIASVPVGDVEFMAQVSYEPTQPRTFVLNSQALESLQISILDDFYEAIEVPFNTKFDISLTLLAMARSFD